MAVTHKQRTKGWTHVVAMCARVVWLDSTTTHWKHVTCKNCLKRRPKGKR